MRSRRVVSAAALLGCAYLASGTVRAGEALNAWSDLWSDAWHTPDQQGQALLDAGDPARAADRFHDPRRRAYADLEAARYQDAAKLLAPFTDPESEYNRGNALANSGQLPAALAAYDAALKQAPTDRDIRHNRDLVERALRQQPQSPQSSAGNGHRGGASPGQQSQQSAAGQHTGERGGSGSRQQGGAAQSSSALARQSSGSHDAASSGAQPGNARPDSGSSKATPDQAQRDAALAAEFARQQRRRGGMGNAAEARGSERNGTAGAGAKGKQPDTGSVLAGGTETPRQKPETEQQLALDQWLRQIPDSPAGLLQRKFLIEHMMKQDNANPGSGD
jgi:Ca-activated chloride channel homolog